MKVVSTARRLSALAAAVAAAVTLASCGGTDPNIDVTTDESGGLVINGETIADADLLSKAKAEGSMTIYTAYTVDKEQKIVDAFEEATGLKVEVVGLGTAPLVTRVQSENQAKQYTADVVKLGNLVNVDKLAAGGLLTSYTPPTGFAVPSNANNAEGKYWAWNQSPLAPGYNTGLVNEADAPKSWADLLDPKWQGKLGLAPFAAGGVEIATFQFVRNEVDPDYWTKLAAQKPSIFAVMASVTQAVTQGSVNVAIVQPSVLGEAISGGAKIKFVPDPTEGLPLSSNFVGKVSNGPHPSVAQVYLNFLFSKAGQTVVSQSIGDYGIRSDVPAPVVAGISMPALDSGYKFFPLDSAETIAKGPAWTQEWNTTFNWQG